MKSPSPSILTTLKHLTHLIVESENGFFPSREWDLVEPVDAFDGWTWCSFRKIMLDLYGGLVLLAFGNRLLNIARMHQLWILARMA